MLSDDRKASNNGRVKPEMCYARPEQFAKVETLFYYICANTATELANSGRTDLRWYSKQSIS